MTKRIDTLIEHVCGLEHPLTSVLRRWCLESRAFLTFAEAHKSKLRKKVRQASDSKAQLDLLAEWATAQHFLSDRRFTVQYEPRRADGGRSADLGVTFRTHTPFQVEVTRLRSGEMELKLARTLADKVGQLAPGMPNLLLVVIPEGEQAAELLSSALKLLNTANFPPELAREFQRGRLRLSAVRLASMDEHANLKALRLWVNAQAKHPLPAEVIRFLHP